MIVLMLVRKYRHAGTVDELVYNALLFGRLVVAGLILMADTAMFAWFCVAAIVVYMSTRWPDCPLPPTVLPLPAESFEAVVMRRDAKHMWFIMVVGVHVLLFCFCAHVCRG